MLADGKQNYSLSLLIQRQKEILDEIKVNYNRLKLNSQGKNFRNIDKEKIILQQKDLREKLVKIKVIINKHNSSIYHDIFRLSELKVFLNELKMSESSKFEEEIKYTEAEIERIEQSLKKHNESVTVPWFSLIEIKMYGPIV